jgi:nicotinic acid mononucleotide adenylyltransferase
MDKFSQYLAESLEVEKLKHLEHVEDHIIHGGHEGVGHAADTLIDTLDFLSGKKTKTKITQKYDGSPSIVFGINPENGKFFVASKSAFNKNPKINYDDKDIEENHGHAPGLVSKLKLALKELPKIMPKKGGVYQGDLMYGKDDLVDNSDGTYSFTPNTITYTTQKGNGQSDRAAAAQIGLVVHTKYVGKKGNHARLADMTANFDVDQNSFQESPNVHRINPEVTLSKNISGIEKKEFQKYIDDATKAYGSVDDHDIFNVLDDHDTLLKTYINTTVRDGTQPSTNAYIKFLDNRYSKELEKLKSEKGREKKKQDMEVALLHVKTHKKQFDTILKIHDSLQKAKDVLNKSLAANSDSGLTTSIGGQPTKPEGFVAIRNGRPSKIVDRAEFSRSNFLQGAFQKNNELQAAPNENTPTNPVVFSYGRMNPPTTGHKVLVDKVEELAKENKAKHKVVLSRSQDPEKNPLTPEQKAKHAKRFFPTANIEIADEESPTIIHHMKKLMKEGHDHVVMVVGSDRVEEMKKLLDSYNGKEFYFKKIDVISAGQRDPDSDDETEAMSGSKMRGHAISKKRKEFNKGIPSHVHPEHAEELYKDVQQGMDIHIGPETNGISLARYAKRQDPIGVKARAEVQRRLVAKETEKRVKAAAKKKPTTKPKAPIKEQAMTASGGDIRGLGYVTGNPDGAFQVAWTQANIADADTRDNILKAVKTTMHDDLHLTTVDDKKKDFVQRLTNTVKSRKA